MTRLLFVCMVLFLLAGCAGMELRVSYPVAPSTVLRVPVRVPGHFGEAGVASFYNDKYQGRLTANGERFDQGAMTAAHKTLPFGTRVRVVNVRNGRSVLVRINDRGPFVRGRIIDLSYAAFSRIESPQKGLADVELEILD